jgi:hypothetical protein
MSAMALGLGDFVFLFVFTIVPSLFLFFLLFFWDTLCQQMALD